MTTREIHILPRPASAYQLLLDAAGAWPDGIAAQWIPDPADHARCLSWTYAELAGTVTRIANALTAPGVRRGDAVTLSGVNTSMLYAATLAAQAAGIAAPVNPALSGERIAELVRRTGANSTIRELTGITMDDLGFTERWLVVDIRAGDRCGADKPAPQEPGGGGLRPLAAAPGTYVFDH